MAKARARDNLQERAQKLKEEIQGRRDALAKEIAALDSILTGFTSGIQIAPKAKAKSKGKFNAWRPGSRGKHPSNCVALGCTKPEHVKAQTGK